MTTPNNPYPSDPRQAPPYGAPPYGQPPYGAPRPPARKGPNPLVIVVVVLVLVGVGVVVASLLRHKPRDVEAEGQKYREASQAFSTSVQLDSPDARDIKAGLDLYTAAIVRKDFAGAADCIDAERMIEEFEGAGLVKGMSRADKRGMAAGLKKGLTSSLSQPYNGLAVTSVEVRKIRMLPAGGEAVAYLKARHPLLGSLKYRWWVVKRDGQWRVYDLEDLDGGLRVSTMMGTMVAAGGGPGGSPPAWLGKAPRLQAMLQAMGGGDVGAMEKIVAELETAGFPAPIQALVVMCKGVTRSAREDHAGALALYDQAGQIQPDLVAVHSLRAAAYNALGRHAEAAASARRYIELLGDDARALNELGTALDKQGDRAGALDAFRRATDDEPGDLDAVAGYARLAAATDRADATRRLVKALTAAADPKVALDALAGEMPDKASMGALIDAYKQVRPADSAALAPHEQRAATLPARAAAAPTTRPASPAPR